MRPESGVVDLEGDGETITVVEVGLPPDEPLRFRWEDLETAPVREEFVGQRTTSSTSCPRCAEASSNEGQIRPSASR